MKNFKSWRELADYITELENQNDYLNSHHITKIILNNDEVLRLKAEIDKLHHDNDVLEYMCERRANTIKGYEELVARMEYEVCKANKGCRRLRCKLNAAEKQLGKLRCKNCSYFADHPYKEGMGICLMYEWEHSGDSIPCYKFKR